MKIGVAGLGLIGGSLALALRDAHDITAYDTDEETRKSATNAGIRIAPRLEELSTADAVVVATPMRAVVPTLERVAAAGDGAVLLDTGSLKRAVIELAGRLAPTTRLVGGHPMAGATASGFSAADRDLFRGRPFLLVPTARSDDRAMAVAGDIARDCGAVVTVCSAEVHDRAMARLIAAPLATAAALAVAGAEADPLVEVAGPGFRDSTRLADTPVEFAADLLLANRDDASGAIGSVREALAQLRDALERDDRELVRNMLLTARSVRDALKGDLEGT